MTQSTMQSLIRPRQRVSAFPGAGLFARLRRVLAEFDARLAREQREREAIEHLETMNDAQLRDIGVHRADIGDAVRFGRRYYLYRK